MECDDQSIFHGGWSADDLGNIRDLDGPRRMRTSPAARSAACGLGSVVPHTLSPAVRSAGVQGTRAAQLLVNPYITAAGGRPRRGRCDRSVCLPRGYRSAALGAADMGLTVTIRTRSSVAHAVLNNHCPPTGCRSKAVDSAGSTRRPSSQTIRGCRRHADRPRDLKDRP
jgi:hypothetical protein